MPKDKGRVIISKHDYMKNSVKLSKEDFDYLMMNTAILNTKNEEDIECIKNIKENEKGYDSMKVRHDDMKIKYDELQEKYDICRKGSMDLIKEKYDRCEKEAENTWCEICNYKFATKSALNLHMTTKKHLNKVCEMNEKDPDCESCKKDAYVCCGHCKACENAIKKHGCYCGLHD